MKKMLGVAALSALATTGCVEEDLTLEQQVMGTSCDAQEIAHCDSFEVYSIVDGARLNITGVNGTYFVECDNDGGAEVRADFERSFSEGLAEQIDGYTGACFELESGGVIAIGNCDVPQDDIVRVGVCRGETVYQPAE